MAEQNFFDLLKDAIVDCLATKDGKLDCDPLVTATNFVGSQKTLQDQQKIDAAVYQVAKSLGCRKVTPVKNDSGYYWYYLQK